MHIYIGNKRKFSAMHSLSSLPSSSSVVVNNLIPDDLAEKINNIIERFEEICKSRDTLHLREEDGARLFPAGQIRPPTSSHMDQRAIFGREDEKERLIFQLLDHSKGPDFMVLPIVGLGGLGKTTLAQLIYNDFRVCQLFDKRVWLSVSDDFDLVRLTKATIESIIIDGPVYELPLQKKKKNYRPCGASELSKLQDILSELIDGTSLFLVVDDVWNEAQSLWESFLVAFKGAKTVRILATTRNISVAKTMKTATSFPLDCLPEEECWLMFKHIALDHRGTSVSADLLEIGHKIVKKCKGLPLVIKVLGCMLRYVIDEEKWREVAELDIQEIDEGGEIMPVLRLSYQKLPLHLKPCLIFLSMFPKGRWIKKDKVVRLWMAQGYINCNAITKKTLEEIGSEYLDELQGRSLVECWNHNECRLHDLIHDLATSVSQRPNQLFLEDDHQQLSSSCEVRHLYLTRQDHNLSGSLEISNNWAIRTLIAETYINHTSLINLACLRALEFNYFSFFDELDTFKYLRYTFKHLRYLFIECKLAKILHESICLLYNLQSLDLQCPLIQELPENIKNLINLRYFCLSSQYVEYLPESMCLLRNLNKLTLEFCSRLRKLPRNIEQLANLRFIDLNGCPNYIGVNGTGKLQNLKTLKGRFDVIIDEAMGVLKELENMNKLSGLLCISGLKYIGNEKYSGKVNCISKPSLHELILNFEKVYCPPNGEDQGLFIVISPSSITKNEYIEKIHECVLDSLQPHHNLKQLKILSYGGMKFPSWLLHHSLMNKKPTGSSFLSLEKVSFCNMPNLIEWEASDGHFPCLKILVINNCPELRKVTIPQEVSVLEIKGCGCQVVNFSSRSKLQLILISNCRELGSIYYKNGDLSALRGITISDCPNLFIFSAILKESKELDNRNCGFQEIEFISESKIKKFSLSDYREPEPVNFENRYAHVSGRVSLSDCPKLILFSAIPVEANMLVIHNCGFCFMMIPSRCQQIKISFCQELLSIYWRNEGLNCLNQIVEFVDCPRLSSTRVSCEVKELRIASCGICEIIFTSQSMIQTVHISDCLELLLVHWKDGAPLYLKELFLEGCPKFQSMLVIPSQICQLVLTECGLHEILFPIQCKIASLRISCCPNLTSLQFLEGELPLLETFSIKYCSRFHEVLTIPNQVKEFDISDCSVHEIHLLPKSNLHNLTINRCAQLTAIKGLQAQCLLISLHISQCPILQFSIDGILQTEMEMVQIYDCPLMDSNRNVKNCYYQRGGMVKRLIASSDEKLLLDSSAERSNILDSSEERRIPLLKNSELVFLQEGSSKVIEAFALPPLCENSCHCIKLHFPMLVELEIFNCQTVISVSGLYNLSNLKLLVISCCPQLCEWKDAALPSELQFLKLIFCHKLSCAPLLPIENCSEALEIIINDCPLMRETASKFKEQNAMRSLQRLITSHARSRLKVITTTGVHDKELA